jgi:hypothetical protein
MTTETQAPAIPEGYEVISGVKAKDGTVWPSVEAAIAHDIGVQHERIVSAFVNFRASKGRGRNTDREVGAAALAFILDLSGPATPKIVALLEKGIAERARVVVEAVDPAPIGDGNPDGSIPVEQAPEPEQAAEAAEPEQAAEAAEAAEPEQAAEPEHVATGKRARK